MNVISPVNEKFSFNDKDYKKYVDDSIELENQYIETIIRETYHRYDTFQPLPSTAILAKGEFNACSIISSPKKFLWMSLHLADKIELFIKKEIKSQRMLRLIGVSLRGAIFTSSVAMLLKYDFDTVDHLGPKHKLYDVDFFENKISLYDYLFIGDFIIGGTEVKIAKTYSQIYGNKLEHAFVIASLFKPERFHSFKLGCLKNIMDLKLGDDVDYKLYLE